MYKGAVIDAIPTPSPTKTRPTMRRGGPLAAAMITAPTKNKKSARRSAGFLPQRSVNHPPKAAPTIAPASAVLTIVSYTYVLSPNTVNNLIYILVSQISNNMDF